MYNPLIKAQLHNQEKHTLAVIGHLAIDNITHPAFEIPSSPGGSAAAVATASVQLGTTTSIFSKVGNDFPMEWLSVLKNLNVDISKVEISEKGKSLQVAIKYNEEGNPQSIECNERILENLDIKPLPRTEWVHVCPLQPTEQLELVQRLKGHCDFLSLSFSEYFSGEYKKDFFGKVDWKAVDIIFANEKEAGAITGLEEPKEMALKFHNEGVDVVAITLGKEGSSVYDGTNFHEIKARVVPVVDSTGCGDSYIGGFLGNYLVSKDTRKAAGMGTYLASLTVQKKGSWAALMSDVGVRF